MKKVSELTGAELDYWVARAQGYEFYKQIRGSGDNQYEAFVYRDDGTNPWDGVRRERQEHEMQRYTKCNNLNEIKKLGFHGSGYPKGSQDWGHGGPIIEREKIELKTHHDQGWGARCNSQRGGATRVVYGYGETPLIAAMRCYVASVYGEYVSE